MAACLYCNKPFDAKRQTKKYCNDNCKQAAYFHRSKPESAIGQDHHLPVKKTIQDILIEDIYAKLNQLMTVNEPGTYTFVSQKQGETSNNVMIIKFDI